MVEPVHERELYRQVFITERELQLLRNELCGAGHGADEDMKLDRQGKGGGCGVVHYTTFAGTMMACPRAIRRSASYRRTRSES